jgi:hypothetical protein
MALSATIFFQTGKKYRKGNAKIGNLIGYIMFVVHKKTLLAVFLMVQVFPIVASSCSCVSVGGIFVPND